MWTSLDIGYSFLRPLESYNALTISLRFYNIHCQSWESLLWSMITSTFETLELSILSLLCLLNLFYWRRSNTFFFLFLCLPSSAAIVVNRKQYFYVDYDVKYMVWVGSIAVSFVLLICLGTSNHSRIYGAKVRLRSHQYI